ncbi:MAG: hypothetical protein M3406_01360 [Chloroflexota bacterium]|nr:hypothetical protein [Chloroflexota bacterium]
MQLSVEWFFVAAIVVMVVRQLPRVIRDLKGGPLPDVGAAPKDAEPIALFLPNDDGLFTWSLRFPEKLPATNRED